MVKKIISIGIYTIIMYYNNETDELDINVVDTIGEIIEGIKINKLDNSKVKINLN